MRALFNPAAALAAFASLTAHLRFAGRIELNQTPPADLRPCVSWPPNFAEISEISRNSPGISEPATGKFVARGRDGRNRVGSAVKRSCRDGLVAFALLGGMHANATGATNPSMEAKMPMNQITIVPDSELELLGVSADHKTLEAPDGTTYQCDGGFYAIKVKGQGTIWCNGKEL